MHPSRNGKVVEIDQLVKRYKNADNNAVDGVDFDILEGEFFALLGANGAGKTTTISILNTTLTPTAGRALISGHDVTREAAAVREQIGVIFQNPSLDLNLTAEENVRFHAVLYGLYPFRPSFSWMPVDYRRKVKDLAAILGISEAMGQPVKTFSGGMKRKLEILRNLLHNPRVLILDEPTTGLDPGSRRNLWSYIARVREESGTSVLLTTHYLEEAEGADRICILDRGKVAAYGTIDEIKKTLIHHYLLIDAADRQALRAELEEKRIPYREDGRFRLDIREDEIHRILRQIQTPLTVVRPRLASLEDAYLAIVEKYD